MENLHDNGFIYLDLSQSNIVSILGPINGQKNKLHIYVGTVIMHQYDL